MTWSNITYDAALISPVCQASLATVDGRVGPRWNHLQRKTWDAALLIQAGGSA
eukprot:gene23603-42628_t